MNLKDQVTSLELSKKLKELGIKQESFAYWIKDFDCASGGTWDLFGEGFFYGSSCDGGCFRMNNDFRERYEHFSAFTASELGEILPYQIDGAWLWLQKDPPIQGEWAIVYSKNVEFDKPLCIERGDTEANLRAKMLIYLLENSLITL